MNVEFKYALDDVVNFKESLYCDGEFQKWEEKTGRICGLFIQNGLNLFGLPPRKPEKTYKIQIGGGWTEVHESSILGKK